jgi:hypothetical protein
MQSHDGDKIGTDGPMKRAEARDGSIVVASQTIS